MDAQRFLGTWVVAASIGVVLLAGCEEGPTGPAPTVVELSPADDARDVSIHTTITAVFSDTFSLEGVEAPVTLERSGITVDGDVTVDGSTLTFVPTAALDPGAVYTATLSAAIAGPGGRPLGRDTSWSFTVAGTPLPDVDTARIKPHLLALAHDSMAGRGSGTEAEVRAAEYIRDRFEAIGLEPAPGGWFQEFQIPEDNPDSLVGATSQNVLGVLPGTGDLAGEWVIVGAHYDHEGTDTIAPDSLVIYNGADDNASGVAVMLAVAETLFDWAADHGDGGESRRSIMFQAFGAEELGLQGSEYYTDHPVVPLHSLAGMLNLDMVGRLRAGEVHVSGFWTSPEWQRVLDRYNTTDLVLIDKQNCQSCSDYAPFRRARRPAVWFFTGFHDQYSGPEDDVELINAAGMARIADLTAGASVHLAVRADLLPFGNVLP